MSGFAFFISLVIAVQCVQATILSRPESLEPTAHSRLRRSLIATKDASLASCILGGPFLGGVATYHPPFDTAAASHTSESGNCGLDLTTTMTGDARVCALSSSLYSNARYCGAFLNVTGPHGWTVVQVTDQGGNAGGLDLSEAAFKAINNGDLTAGVISISFTVIPGTTILGAKTVKYRFKGGSTVSWVGVEILDHLVPLTEVQFVQNGITWSTTRQSYNFWIIVSNGQQLKSGPLTIAATGSTNEVIQIPVSQISGDETELFSTSVQFKSC